MKDQDIYFTDIVTHFDDVAALLKAVPPHIVVEIADRIDTARIAGRRVFVIGNGGSAATATHFAADLGKNVAPRVRAMSFDNLASLTAYANDDGYAAAYERQLALQANTDDVIVALSTSGNSANILYALEEAGYRHLHRIGLSGNPNGLMNEMVDTLLLTPHKAPEVVEDVHAAICHAVIVLLRRMGR